MALMKIDTDVEVLESLDFAPRCQAVHLVSVQMGPIRIPIGVQPCAETAEWLATCRTCGCRWVLCTPHRNLGPEVICECPRCETEAPVDSLAVVEPLDPRASS